MKVFISYAYEDRNYADLISNKLREAGHNVWYDAWTLNVGDNIVEKINDGLKDIDAFIVIISKHSLGSNWVSKEYSLIAFSEIHSKKRRIIPILIDQSTIPQYLDNDGYIDLTVDRESGLMRLLKSLKDNSLLLSNEMETLKKRNYDEAISALSQALHNGYLTLVCGAGISVEAGIPLWNELLLSLLESTMKRISLDHPIILDTITPDEFQKKYGASTLIIGKYLKTNLGNDFLLKLREALYSGDPRRCDMIDAITELARPHRGRKSLESIITFNFDDLIEENLEINNILHKSISVEGVRNRPNELPIYHVHGFLPRKREINQDMEVVFSEDSYHSQFIDPFSWSNLIQLNKLSQNTCLFLGISLTDPNLRRLLDVAKRKNPSKILNHYIIKKVPCFNNIDAEKLAAFFEEQDANELGLNMIWVQEYSEIVPLLKRMLNP